MTLSPGTRLGPYEISVPIGKGGMGEVYRARDTKLGRDVAVKVLPAAFAQDHERVARFRREAQVLASFNHPNIASIHGFEESPSGVAIALELVEGEDLQQRLRRGPIPVGEARAIARQIAEGLEAAHEKGIVHRDLKPANVKVTPEGQVKVLDFGLAKAFDTEPGATGSSNELTHSPTLSRHATEAGIVLGTAAYMSPEQARGKPVDKRADIWSFGVVLFEMLSGRRLFQGETASDTLAAVLRQDIDWSLLPKELGALDQRLLERCLARDPKIRLRDIGEARIALGEEKSPAVEPLAGTGTGGSRRELLRLGAAAAVGVVGGAGLTLLRFGGASNGEDQRSLRTVPLTSSGNVISVSISPDGKLIAYVESEQGMQALWLQQVESGQSMRLIPERGVAYWSHVFTPDGNAVVFGEKSQADPKGALYSISTLGGTARRLVSDIDSAPTFSPDGQRMAFTRMAFPNPDETALMVASKDGADPKPLATFKRPEQIASLFYGGPTWAPDGRTIATAVNRAAHGGTDARAWLVSVSVDGGLVETLADPGWVEAYQSQFLPDGKSLVVIANSPDQPVSQLWKVALPGGLARTLTSDLNDHRIVSLTRDGKALVSVSGDVSSSVWAVPVQAGARPRRMGRGRNDGLDGVAFGEKGRLIYTANTGGRWSLWSGDLGTGDRQILITAEPGVPLLSPAATADGAVYFFTRNLRGSQIQVLEKGSSKPRTITSTAGFGEVSRDGRFLVYPNTLEKPNETPRTPAGSLAVRQQGFGRLFRRDLKTGEERQLIDLPAYRPSIDPEGRRVAFYFNTPEGSFRFGVCSAEGGALLADLPAEPVSTTASRIVLRGEGLYVNTVAGDRANVWFVPLSGGPARRITAFTDQLLFDFALSDTFEQDQTILVSRGPRLRDAQLITGF